MIRINEKVRDIVEVRPFKNLRDLDADPALTLASYRFTDFTSALMVKWIKALASSREQGSAMALAGWRGVGKSHFLAVIAAMAAQPELSGSVTDAHVRSSAEKLKSSRNSVVMVRRGTGDSLLSELRTAFFRSLDLKTEHDEASPVALFRSARDKAGDRGLVVLIDTADGREGRVSREDGKLLGEFALAAKELGVFIGVVLDDDISNADGANVAISSAFSIDYLEQEHIYRIIDAEIFPKNPRMRGVLRKLYESFRSDNAAFRWSEERFSALYPMHPAIAEIAPAVRLHLQNFALLGFASDAGIRVQGRPANSLIGLDELFDVVENQLRNVPDLAPVFEAVRTLEANVISRSEVKIRLSAKLALRALLLLSLDGRGATADELSASLLLPELDTGSALHIDRLLADFAEAVPQAFVVQEKGGVLRYVLGAGGEQQGPPDETLQEEEINTLIFSFFGGREPADPRVQELAAKHALPLGLAEVGGDILVPSAAAVNTAGSPVAWVIEQLSSDPGKLFEIGSVQEGLDTTVPRHVQHMILAALACRDRLELVTHSGSRINGRSLDLQISWDDIAGIALPKDESASALNRIKWARRISGNDQINSLVDPTLRDELQLALNEWLSRLRDENLTEELKKTLPDVCSAALWKRVNTISRSMALVASSIESLLNGKLKLEQCLDRISRVFAEDTSNLDTKQQEVAAVKEMLSELQTRQKVMSYITLAQVTDHEPLERMRLELFEKLRNYQAPGETSITAFSANNGFDEFRELYVAMFQNQHRIAHDMQAAGGNGLAMCDTASLADSLRKEPFCHCGFRMRDFASQ
jgi:hypothetical protein